MKIVKVTWIDAQRLELGVQDILDIKKVEPIACDIVGFLVYEDDKKIIVAQEKWDELQGCKYVHVISKVSIIKDGVVELKVEKRGDKFGKTNSKTRQRKNR